LPNRRRRQEEAIETDLDRGVDGNAALGIRRRAVDAGAVLRVGRDDAERGPEVRLPIPVPVVAA
jgi:hypothetical protein